MPDNFLRGLAKLRRVDLVPLSKVNATSTVFPGSMLVFDVGVLYKERHPNEGVVPIHVAEYGSRRGSVGAW